MDLYLVTFLLIFSVGCSSPDSSSAQTEIDEEIVTETVVALEIDVEAIELLDLEGNPVSWESLKGKKVFLNFWATWCKPCIVEMPSMHQAAEQLGDDYVFLAASYEDLSKIQKFVQSRDFAFQFVHSKTSLDNLNIYSLPTTFLINAEGKLVETVVGSREWNEPEAMDKLKAL